MHDTFILRRSIEEKTMLQNIPCRSIEEKTVLQTTLPPIMANLDSRLSELNLDVQEVKEMLDIAKRPKVHHPISTSVVIHLCVFF